MIKSYFKITPGRIYWEIKVSSFIETLADCALWHEHVNSCEMLDLLDELSFNKKLFPLRSCAGITWHGNINGDIYSGNTIAPMGEELREKILEAILKKYYNGTTLDSRPYTSYETKKLKGGTSFEPSAIDLLSIKWTDEEFDFEMIHLPLCCLPLLRNLLRQCRPDKEEVMKIDNNLSVKWLLRRVWRTFRSILRPGIEVLLRPGNYW